MAMFGGGDLVAKPSGQDQEGHLTRLSLSQDLALGDRALFGWRWALSHKNLERWGKTWHSGSLRSLCKRKLGASRIQAWKTGQREAGRGARGWRRGRREEWPGTSPMRWGCCYFLQLHWGDAPTSLC